MKTAAVQTGRGIDKSVDWLREFSILVTGESLYDFYQAGRDG